MPVVHNFQVAAGASDFSQITPRVDKVRQYLAPVYLSNSFLKCKVHLHMFSTARQDAINTTVQKYVQ